MRSNFAITICLDYVGIALSFCSLGFGQKIGNEASYPSISQSSSVTSPASQDHTDYMTIWQIDWAAAGSRPRAPIYNYTERPEIFFGLVARHESYRAYWDRITERESAKCYRRSVLGMASFKYNWS